MFQKFANFWRFFLNSLKTAYNKAFKEIAETVTQKWEDTHHINFLAIFVDKLSNLSLTDATFELETDSAVASPLADLVKSVEEKKYDITQAMLGDGNYYVFPAINEKGEVYNTYLQQSQVRIVNMSGDNVTEAYGIIDWYLNSKTNRLYYLLRNHKLEPSGTLTISYSVVDESGNSARVEQWEYLQDEAVQYENANHIGFSWFKSPVASRGLSSVYGVPLNFGCEEIEKRIFEDMKYTDTEFKNAASKIFTDPRNLMADKDTGEYKIVDNIFAVQSRAGQTTSNIDIYSPEIRYEECHSKLLDDLMQYEQQVGVDRGFLTPFESGSAVTATEIRRANASTIAMIEKIHSALAKGIEETVKADAVFLNIAEDLYAVKIDWYDAFENADTQWQRLIDGHSEGVVEAVDLAKWLFPNLSNEEIEKKLSRIAEKTALNTDQAIERILQGGR